ncbi:GlsB/YeaQ/YmgE family stress response membrane protein [Luteimonas sp. 50]|uniref:GlsB/YeaQ/YmgE family stress response membrane protein n=1 Tax=Cognatiluteimonas sedimenti TaxID=2927791 RepID=A0ABT0A4D6_9GAMM|nr:GlsB/YeaQ/YmgE family stress response membrane protein [Lysobacter sedimenti]MCJ0825841.1 GlsB/YeaQ/YmgE family stress response membrane protein [Lysobacter sedimenti]
MGGILYTILIGAVIGVLARFFKPGADPMGWILTILLGVVGAWIGSYVSGALGIGNRFLGFAVSIACAVLLLFVYGMVRKKTPKAA